MPIELNKETQKRLVGSIQHYFQKNMEDEDVGDLKALLLLEFFIKELGPAIYNQAISDAQGVMLDRVTELDSVCFASDEDFGKSVES
jgi:uncharacterized protein (DUF2164 family)